MSTDAALVARELRDREPIFHRPAHGSSRADFEAMTVIDYWEVGASGTIRQGERRTRRVSVWRRTGTAWILVYHQGTVISPGP